MREAKGEAMAKRILPQQQIDMFESLVPHWSQGEVAKQLGVTTRQIQYWEKLGLVHPEVEESGRERRYTSNDLIELLMVATMLDKQGYTVPKLKQKLDNLRPPYYYDANDMHWDLPSSSWMSSADFAIRELSDNHEQLRELIVKFMEETSRETEPATWASSLLRAMEEWFKGSRPKVKRATKSGTRRRTRKKPTPAPLFDDNPEA